jgi:hypothetical protein
MQLYPRTHGKAQANYLVTFNNLVSYHGQHIIGERGWGGMDGIHPAQDRDQWRALLNTVMNLRVPYNIGKFLSRCTTGGVSKKFSSMEL